MGIREAARKVEVQIGSGHGQNHLKIVGPKSNFHAVIEVPRKTDLRVRMSAGELSIGDVEGNKDIEIIAGNLKLNSLRPQDYARADFSVRIGDVYAPLLKTARAVLWRSFKTCRPGQISFARARGSGRHDAAHERDLS